MVKKHFLITPDISTNVGSVYFTTTLILASGCITETPKFFLEAKKFGCAAMVTRSLREIISPEREHVPAPRHIVPSPDMMISCEWGNEKDWTNLRDKWIYEIKNVDSPVIISLSGRDIKGCLNLIKVFDKLQVDAYEINISCPHSSILYGNLSSREHITSLLKEVRRATKTPIWVKLSYSSSVTEIAKIAEGLGANALVCTNTIGPGLMRLRD